MTISKIFLLKSVLKEIFRAISSILLLPFMGNRMSCQDMNTFILSFIHTFKSKIKMYSKSDIIPTIKVPIYGISDIKFKDTIPYGMVVSRTMYRKNYAESCSVLYNAETISHIEIYPSFIYRHNYRNNFITKILIIYTIINEIVRFRQTSQDEKYSEIYLYRYNNHKTNIYESESRNISISFIKNNLAEIINFIRK